MRFLIRWVGSSLGLLLAAELMSHHISYGNSVGVILGAGFLIAVLNMLLRPLLIILSLPVVILSLGLFIFIINGLVVWLVGALYPPLHIAGFWTAVFAAIIIGLVNYLVTALLEVRE